MIFHDLRADLEFITRRFKKSRWRTIAASRGFHALVCYRTAHWLWKNHVPLLPLLLTRLINILYAIDIDCRSQIDAGIAIIHGIGTVIGGGAVIGRGTLIYHGVTLGVKGSRHRDGFPKIGANCILGAGAKIFGDLTVGAGSVIGANVVLTESVPPASVVKLPPPIISALASGVVPSAPR